MFNSSGIRDYVCQGRTARFGRIRMFAPASPGYNPVMRTGVLLAAVAVLCGTFEPASAQTLSVEFHDGRVRLVAENVPVSRILAEWSRVGGTRFVNGERVPGAPVTLQLIDVSEQQALDTVLRGAAGYMVADRDSLTPGGSAFDRVLILPTTARAPSTPPPAAPPPAPPILEDQAEPEVEAPVPAPGLPRRFQPGVNIPGGSTPPAPQPDGEGPSQDRNRPAVSPGNPFGAIPGSAQPGVITPPPPQNTPPGR
jgi:hypothetical protein